MAETTHVDDRYMDGVWFDGTTGEFYTFNRFEHGIQLREPETGNEVEALSVDEFIIIQHDLYRVPEVAIEDPVRYFKDWASDSMSESFDAGLRYADRNIEIVERD